MFLVGRAHTHVWLVDIFPRFDISGIVYIEEAVGDRVGVKRLLLVEGRARSKYLVVGIDVTNMKLVGMDADDWS